MGSDMHGELQNLKHQADQLIYKHMGHKEWQEGIDFVTGDLTFEHDKDSREDEMYAIQYQCRQAPYGDFCSKFSPTSP